MPVSLRRIGNHVYNRVGRLAITGCLGCDFRLSGGSCALKVCNVDTMCNDSNGKLYKYTRSNNLIY